MPVYRVIMTFEDGVDFLHYFNEQEAKSEVIRLRATPDKRYTRYSYVKLTRAEIWNLIKDLTRDFLREFGPGDPQHEWFEPSEDMILVLGYKTAFELNILAYTNSVSSIKRYLAELSYD